LENNLCIGISVETVQGLAGKAAQDKIADSDGLSDLTERLLGLNPYIADTNPQVRLARITAIQICGERQIEESLPLLAQTAATDPDLSTRISAIGALGLLGGRPEMQLLDQIAAENNPRLRPALTLATHRVSQRLSNP